MLFKRTLNEVERQREGRRFYATYKYELRTKEEEEAEEYKRKILINKIYSHP